MSDYRGGMSLGTDSKSDLIVDASTRVFPRLGYHKATVEDIIQEANVARSTFYVYFSSKREIFDNIMGGLMEGMLSTIEAGVDSIVETFGGSDSPGDAALMGALVDLLNQVFGFIDMNRGMTRIFLNDLIGIDNDMTMLFHEFQDKLTGDFERLIHFGLDIGFLRQVDQRRAAEFIVGGLIHVARDISTGVIDSDIDEMSREIVDMQLNGLRPAGARVGAPT